MSLLYRNPHYKKKFFVRYFPGAGGHFISLMLISLGTDINMLEPHRGHLNLNDINLGHNFGNQWNNPDFIFHTSFYSDIEKSKEWFKKNFEFQRMERDYYTVHTHCINPDPIIEAFNLARLININHTAENLDQLAYNWITKSCLLHKQWHIIRGHLGEVKNINNKLLDLDPESINENTDLKLLTYLERFGIIRFHEYFVSYNAVSSDKCFNINYNDIVSGKIIDQLDDIIEFSKIKVSPDRKSKTLTLIENYVKSQTPIPWALNINDY